MEPIRIRMRKAYLFEEKRLLPLNKSVNLVLGKNRNANIYQIQSISFNTNPTISKAWSLKKAKRWIDRNKNLLKSFHVEA